MAAETFSAVFLHDVQHGDMNKVYMDAGLQPVVGGCRPPILSVRSFTDCGYYDPEAMDAIECEVSMADILLVQESLVYPVPSAMALLTINSAVGHLDADQILGFSDNYSITWDSPLELVAVNKLNARILKDSIPDYPIEAVETAFGIAPKHELPVRFSTDDFKTMGLDQEDVLFFTHAANQHSIRQSEVSRAQAEIYRQMRIAQWCGAYSATVFMDQYLPRPIFEKGDLISEEDELDITLLAQEADEFAQNEATASKAKDGQEVPAETLQVWRDNKLRQLLYDWDDVPKGYRHD